MSTSFRQPRDHVERDFLKAMLGKRFEENFAGKWSVRVVPMADFEASTGGWVSWKTARIIDQRNREIDLIEQEAAYHLAKITEKMI